MKWVCFRLLVASVAVAACGGQTGPRLTLEHYGEALREGNYGRAYGLMSESFRAKYSQAEFVKMMKESSQEVAETAAQLSGATQSFAVSAQFRYGLGDTMRLVMEDGRWVVASNPVEFYGQDTPRQALRSFLRAYRLRRWKIMLRFVPSAYLEHMNVTKLKSQFEGPHRDEMDSLMSTLEAHLDAPIDDRGNEARMKYGDRYEVKFVREAGIWKIKDFD